MATFSTLVHFRESQLVILEVLWDAPTDARGRALRRVGDASAIFFKASGFKPNQRIQVVNVKGAALPGGEIRNHIPLPVVSESSIQPIAEGCFEVRDRTPIPADFKPGDHLVTLKIFDPEGGDSFVLVAFPLGFTIGTDVPRTTVPITTESKDKDRMDFVPDTVLQTQPTIVEVISAPANRQAVLWGALVLILIFLGRR